MTQDPGSPRRRRRRAVWRAGVGISRPGETTDSTDRTEDTAAASAATSAVDDTAVAPRPAPPAERPEPATDPVADPAPAEARPSIRRRRTDPTERGLRDLVGAGPSQLDPARAMRARDANRPTAKDLAEAEQDVAIVRRHWKPPAS